MNTGISLASKSTEGEEFLMLNLSQLGINSLNAIDIFLTIEDLFKLESFTFDEFLSCNTLNELILKIKANLNDDSPEKSIVSESNQFGHLKAIAFSENKEFVRTVLRLICETYPVKNDLCISFVDYDDLYDAYKPIVEFLENSPESFIVYDTIKNKYVGGAYITSFDKPLPYSNDIPNDSYINTMLNELESEVVEKNAKGLMILSADLIATDLDSTLQENICIINFIENQIIEVAKRFNYDAIIAANSNKLTQVTFFFCLFYLVKYF
jgi:acyl carrier protein